MRGPLAAIVLTVAACGGSGARAEDAAAREEGLSPAEAARVCAEIAPPRPWTPEDAETLLTETVRRFAEIKRDNDALIARRGVGNFAGSRTEVWKAIRGGDRALAARLVEPHLREGFDADEVVASMQGTSCIGFVYRLLGAAYAALGRADEWKTVERCGRAWNSDGLHLQQALIRNGWPAPTLGYVTDASVMPGEEEDDIRQHRGFLRAAARGSYFGTPVATDVMLQNFLPSPGSSTPLDETMLLRLGRSRTLAMSTMRGAYHVPFIVPGSVVPADLAPQGAAGLAWNQARDRGEPFVLESHSLREPWDETNFEVRSLKMTIEETFGNPVTYATGTLLFSPASETPLSEQN